MANLLSETGFLQRQFYFTTNMTDFNVNPNHRAKDALNIVSQR